MLKIKNLSKTYPNGVKALNNINLTIQKGLFGLLGPNGAGKSSLMRTIATLQEPDFGSIQLDEINIIQEKEKLRGVLGYLPQEFGVYPNINAEDLLNHLAVLKGISDSAERKKTVAQLLELTNLSQHKKKNLGGYSGGMKQRFGIAQALLANPQIIIVDEPTAGLDPDERDRFHNLLSLIGENVTVILSTHIVSDVSDLCQDMAIINGGQVLVQADPQEAIQSINGCVWQKLVHRNEIETISQKHNLISSRLTHGKMLVKIYNKENPQDGFTLDQPNLEDVYFSYIRKFIQ